MVGRLRPKPWSSAMSSGADLAVKVPRARGSKRPPTPLGAGIGHSGSLLPRAAKSKMQAKITRQALAKSAEKAFALQKTPTIGSAVAEGDISTAPAPSMERRSRTQSRTALPGIRKKPRKASKVEAGQFVAAPAAATSAQSGSAQVDGFRKKKKNTRTPSDPAAAPDKQTGKDKRDRQSKAPAVAPEQLVALPQVAPPLEPASAPHTTIQVRPAPPRGAVAVPPASPHGLAKGSRKDGPHRGPTLMGYTLPHSRCPDSPSLITRAADQGTGPQAQGGDR